MTILVFVVLLKFFKILKCGQLDTNQTLEQNLFNTLMSGYNKNIRPTVRVQVNMTVSLKHIVSLDEKNQVLLTSSYISQEWYDPRLTWSVNVNNTNIMMIPVKSLWIPDTMVLNTADSDGYLKYSDFSLATVQSDGHVFVIVPASATRTRCDLDIDLFPYDKQTCDIILTSWSYGTNRNDYALNNALDFKDFIENQIWVLSNYSMYTETDTDRNPFEETQNKIIVIRLDLSRKPLYYMISGVFPCIVLNIVSILAFLFPYAQQVTLGMTMLLTYGIYAIRVSSDLPIQSDYLPTISIYYITSLLLTVIAMIWFFYFNHLQTQNSIPSCLLKVAIFLRNIFGKRRKIETKLKQPVVAKTLDVENRKKIEKSEFDMNLSMINMFFLFVYATLLLITLLAIWLSI